MPAVIAPLLLRLILAGIPLTQTVPHDIVPIEVGLVLPLIVSLFVSELAARNEEPIAATVALRVALPEDLGFQLKVAIPPMVVNVCTLCPLANRVTLRSLTDSQRVALRDALEQTMTSTGLATAANKWAGVETVTVVLTMEASAGAA